MDCWEFCRTKLFLSHLRLVGKPAQTLLPFGDAPQPTP
jgi:hypothetical protein